jgi:hypothetical protein
MPDKAPEDDQEPGFFLDGGKGLGLKFCDCHVVYLQTT